MNYVAGGSDGLSPFVGFHLMPSAFCCVTCSSALESAKCVSAGEGVTEAEIFRCQAVCLTNRAAALKMLNRLPEAIDDCRSAMTRDRGYVKAYTRAAKYHLQRAETDQAHACLENLSRDSLTEDDSAEIDRIEAEIRGLRADISKLDEVRFRFQAFSLGYAYNLRRSTVVESASNTTGHCRWRRTSCGILVVQGTFSSSAVKSSELSTAASWYGVLLASSRCVF